MNQDSCFNIGKTHQVCQDYTLASTKDDIRYCIVCDGCSSSPDTDFGARIIARSALEYINSDSDEIFGSLVINKAKNQAQNLELNPRALDCTLLTLVHSTKDNLIKARMFGDGALCVKYKNGDLEVIRANYSDNTPFYINYLLDNSCLQQIIKLNANNNIFSSELYDSNYKLVAISEIATLNEIPYYSEIFSAKDVEHISIMSDGIESFERTIKTDTSINAQRIEPIEIIKHLLAFKGMQSSFVQRRVQKYLKQCMQENVYHNDDLSVAVMSL